MNFPGRFHSGQIRKENKLDHAVDVVFKHIFFYNLIFFPFQLKNSEGGGLILKEILDNFSYRIYFSSVYFFLIFSPIG